MDPVLLNTVREAHVQKLIKLCDTHNNEFFLTQEEDYNRNMLHLVCVYRIKAFAEEALRRLPKQVVRQLICQPDSDGNNPLHVATSYGYLDIVKLLVKAYNRSSDDDGADDLSCPPWRAKNGDGELPVQVAVRRGKSEVASVVRKRHNEVAAFLISVDPDVLRSDDAGSLLTNGSGRTSKAIVTPGVECSIKGFDPRSVGDLVSRCSDERDVLVFFQQHQELVKCLDYSDKMNVLCRAIEKNYVDVATTILISIDISASSSSTLQLGEGYVRPFRHAAEFGHVEIAKLIVDKFRKSFNSQLRSEKERAAPLKSSGTRSCEITEEKRKDLGAETLLCFQAPWKQTGKDGLTPLGYALRSPDPRFSKSILKWDLEFLAYLAEEYEGIDQDIVESRIVPAAAVFVELEQIKRRPDLNLKPSLMTLHLETFLQFLRENPDITTTKLLKQGLELIKLKDDSGRSILQYALDENKINIMNLLLLAHPLAISIPNGNGENILMTACRNRNFDAVQNICRICPDSPQAAICQEDESTVLHNIELRDLKEYRTLLGIPGISMLINKPDALRRTPLMKAIQAEQRYLVEALLEQDGVDVLDIKSKEGKTAAEMLKEKAKENGKWDNLYKKMKKRLTSYINVGTDLKEMRSTLLVVAALLATITFATAFTLPGGLDQNHGYVLLGHKASFIMFIVSDTYAMCCSMIVLYSLIWSMVWDSNTALVLIDRSVLVLRQSLYGTLIAFMTGVYTVLSQKSLPLAIAVIVMCCVAPILSNRWILVTLLDKFVPASRPRSSLDLEEISIQP